MRFRLCRIATARNTQGSLSIIAPTVNLATCFSERYCCGTMVLEDNSLNMNVLRNVETILIRKKGLTTRHLVHEEQLCSGFFIEYLTYKSKQESSTQK